MQHYICKVLPLRRFSGADLHLFLQLFKFPFIDVRYIPAFKEDLSVGLVEQMKDDPAERRFPAAGFSDDA